MDRTAIDDSFRTTADQSIGELTVDADAILTGVYRRHRRYQRRRLMGTGVGVVAMVGLAVAAVTAGVTDSGGSGSGGEDVVALAPYTVSVTDDAPVLATVDGVELTYLPPDVPTEPSIVESLPYVDASGRDVEGGTNVLGVFVEGDPVLRDGTVGLGVAVSRAPDLDLESYQEANWVGDDPTETTVGGHPALATDVDGSGEAAGLVWSPRDGVVIAINLDSLNAEELRKIVDGVRFR